MVFKFKVGKLEYHAPPFTQEEDDEFYNSYSRGIASGKATVAIDHNAKRPPPSTPSPKRGRRPKAPD